MSPDVGDSQTVQEREGQEREGRPGEGQPGEGQPREGQPREGQPREGQPREDGLAGVVRQAVVRPPRAVEPRGAAMPRPVVTPSAADPLSAAKPRGAADPLSAAARKPTASSASGPTLVHARGLTKRYGDFTAVDRIDFDLIRGEAFGFLGPNGAGKSSTMRMIGCVSPPSAGTLRILGLDPVADGPAIRARLGVVPQEDTLDVELTVSENLLIYGRYFGLRRDVIRERAAGLLDFVRLSDRAGDKVESLSGGMKRRLTIARSLINEPEIPAARRTDHGAGPAGQTRALGPPLQAQAAGCDADPHHPLHG